MDLELKGLNAVVSGDTKGIGRAIVETLAAEGANVSLCARHKADVEQAVAALSGKGTDAFGSAIDVANGRRWRIDARRPALRGTGYDYT